MPSFCLNHLIDAAKKKAASIKCQDQTDGRTDERMDGRTHGRRDGRTDPTISGPHQSTYLNYSAQPETKKSTYGVRLWEFLKI